MRLARPLVLLALALVAAPALAYTIYLKDGSRIVAKEKYVIQGGKAIILLPSGTQSMISADEIDVPRTEEANTSRLGTAMTIEGGETKELKAAAAPQPKKLRVQDLIRTNEAGIQKAPDRPAQSSVPAAGATAPARARASVQRAQYGDPATVAEIRSFVAARGVTGVAVHRSARGPSWPLLVYETATEGSVFKAIVVSSNALISLASRLPGAIEGFEVVCETPDGGSGGRFELTPQLAGEIVSGRYEITRFYVENVGF